ncbi:MAG: hypothetical protein JSR17_01850 [Proteobacteria bacterium]|nr:hypothetical protein [Pseudomonadota bacterium]
MEKSSEGVVFSSLNARLSELQEALHHVHSLPKLARIQFINDIKQSVGDLRDPHLPESIKPILNFLINTTGAYLHTGDEKAFMSLCEQAIEECRKGWSYLCYWVSSEQNLCYNIYWGLKAALEKHRRQVTMYTASRNDAPPRMQFYKLPVRRASRMWE